jgi:hypothetical protein
MKPSERRFKAEKVLRESARAERGGRKVFPITVEEESSEGRSP